MKVLGIDQSISKCSLVCMEDKKVLQKYIVRTGNTSTKHKKGVEYFDTLEDQIHYICLYLIDIVQEFEPDLINFESLSFGSVGSQSRNLAQLFGAMQESLINIGYRDKVSSTAPTALKSFARKFLPEEKQFDGFTTAKKPKLVKMDKKLMVEACENVYGEDYLKGYNFSNGKDDLADGTFLALIKFE
jgi:hypothetical protein